MGERYDLIVVGAGPGGSSTAYHAARSGLRTLLLDRQRFPRDKPCGDGLMPHAAAELALMGLGGWLEEGHHGAFTGFTIYSETAVLRQKVPPTLNGPHGYVVRRKETDARVAGRAREAGAELLEGDAGSMVHPISGKGVGYALESGRLAAAFAHEAHARRDFSAALLSGYERRLRRLRAREHLSGHALVHLVPNLRLLEPLFKACERDPDARRTLVEAFTGDSPVYSLLRHPRALAGALREGIRGRAGAGRRPGGTR